MTEIVAILGSPRRGGNSELLLETFLSSIDNRERVEILVPSEMNIHFCRGCRFCERMGYCVIADDMSRVGELLVGACKVVLSSPVFFYGFPASLKALIDRTQYLWARRRIFHEVMPPKEGFLLAVGATKGKRLFEGLILTARYFFDSFGCILQDSLFFRGFDAPRAVGNCGECLRTVEEAGKSFL